MKAILEFDMNDPDDKQAHYRCVKATDMAIMLQNLMWCRKKFEYMIEGEKIKGEGAYEMLEAFIEYINEEAQEHGIDIDNLLT